MQCVLSISGMVGESLGPHGQLLVSIQQYTLFFRQVYHGIVVAMYHLFRVCMIVDSSTPSQWSFHPLERTVARHLLRIFALLVYLNVKISTT